MIRFEVKVDGQIVEVMLELTSPPQADDGTPWSSHMFLEHEGRGLGCGLGNTDDTGTTTDTLAPFGFDQEEGDLTPGSCEGTFDFSGANPTVTLRLDLAATGVTPDPGTRIGVSTRAGVDEQSSSTDFAFDGVDGADGSGIVTLEELCSNTSQTGACTE